eukprot:11019126-Alexandrium_andersonii.AAC.1
MCIRDSSTSVSTTTYFNWRPSTSSHCKSSGLGLPSREVPFASQARNHQGDSPGSPPARSAAWPSRPPGPSPR